MHDKTGTLKLCAKKLEKDLLIFNQDDYFIQKDG